MSFWSDLKTGLEVTIDVATLNIPDLIDDVQGYTPPPASPQPQKVKIQLDDSLFLERSASFHAESISLLASLPPPEQMSPVEETYAAGAISIIIGESNLNSNNTVNQQLESIQNNQMSADETKITAAAKEAQSSQTKSGGLKIFSWAVTIAETVVGAALCTTGAGAVLGAELLVSGAIGVVANVAGNEVTKIVAKGLEDLGLSKEQATICATIIVTAGTIAACLKLPSSLAGSLAGRLTSSLASTSVESAQEILTSATNAVKSLDKAATNAGSALNAINALDRGSVVGGDLEVTEQSLQNLDRATTEAKQASSRLQAAITDLKTTISEGSSAKVIAGKSQQVLDLAQACKTATKLAVDAADQAVVQISQATTEVGTSITEAVTNAQSASKSALNEIDETSQLSETFNDSARATATPTSLAGKMKTFLGDQMQDVVSAKRTLVNVNRARWFLQASVGAVSIGAAHESGEAGFAQAGVIKSQASFNQENTIIRQSIDEAKNFLQAIDNSMSQAGQALSNSRVQSFQA